MSRRHQLIRYRLLAAFAERLQPHGLGGQGEALPPLLLVALDSAVSLDLVGDNLDLTVDGLAIVGDTLDPDNDNGSHDGFPSTSSRQLPPALV